MKAAIVIMLLLLIGCIKENPVNETITAEDIQIQKGLLAIEDGKTIRRFTMTVEKFKFTPMIIQVKKGETVRINLTSLDAFHGFYLEEFEVNEKLDPGESRIIEFIPHKRGIFIWRSNVFSGGGYNAMRGQIIVEEP